MYHYFKTMIAAACAVVLFAGTEARASTVDWSAEGGFSNFDSQTVTFSGFTADTLTNVTGSAWFHTHSTSTTVTFTLDILLDGSWTQIFTASTNSVTQVAGNTLATIISNVSFSEGVVSGIRAIGTPPVGVAMHNWAGTKFNFDDTISAVPVPASLPLIGLGLLAFGAVSRRKSTSV